MIARIAQSLRRKPGPPIGPEGPFLDSVRDAMRDVQAYARSHGGQIDLVSVDEAGTVKVRFRGACAGCPMSSITLRLGIEERLRSLAPGVRDVVSL